MRCSVTIFFILSTVVVSSKGYRLIKVRTPAEATDGEYFSLDFVGLLQEHSYKVDEHYVTTPDGYILSLYRVFSNSTFDVESEKRPVIFLQHALVLSSDEFYVLGPERSFGFLLSEMGYDVWLGNARGNVYSRKHKSLSPEDSNFWNFCLDDIAMNDLPIMIDYVLETTGQSSLTYLGHSMGTTTLLMLLSEREEYSKKIDLAILIAPLDYWRSNNLTRVLYHIFYNFMRLFYPDGAGEFVPLNSLIPAVYKWFCQNNQVFYSFCVFFIEVITGYNPKQMSTETLSFLVNYFPAGGSYKTVYHYIQMHDEGRFQRYDYKDLNLQHYGQSQPPEYDMANITTPMVMFCGGQDTLSTANEIDEMVKILPNGRNVDIKVIEDFSHVDFVFARDSKKLFYKPLIEVLRKYHSLKNLEFKEL